MALSLSRVLAFGAGVAAYLLIAGQFVVSKHGVGEGLTPYDITALRFGVAGLIAFPILVRWGLKDLGQIGWMRGAVLSATSIGTYLLMIFGLSFAPAAHVVVISPGTTLIGGYALSILWLREDFRGTGVWIIVAGLAGLGLIGWESLTERSDDTWIGDGLFALSGLVWAVYMTLLNHWQVNPVRAAVSVSFLSLFCLPLYGLAATSGFGNVGLGEIVFQAVYQGLFHGIIAMALFAHAVRLLGAGEVSLMSPVVPAAGLTMAGLFLNEILSGQQWVGAGLVCCGLVLAAYQSIHRPRHP